MYTTVVGENKYIIVQGVDMREMRQTAPPSSPPHPTSIRSEAPTYSSGEGGVSPVPSPHPLNCTVRELFVTRGEFRAVRI